MANIITFSPVANSDGIYLVHDRLSGMYSIGKVARVNRHWVAILPGERSPYSARIAFSTRREAANALARYGDTGNEAWIFPVRKEN